MQALHSKRIFGRGYKHNDLEKDHRLAPRRGIIGSRWRFLEHCFYQNLIVMSLSKDNEFINNPKEYRYKPEK